jgi:hypothetical protein
MKIDDSYDILSEFENVYLDSAWEDLKQFNLVRVRKDYSSIFSICWEFIDLNLETRHTHKYNHKNKNKFEKRNGTMLTFLKATNTLIQKSTF